MSDLTPTSPPVFAGEKFTSSLVAFKMHMENGDPLAFRDSQFITKDTKQIAFLKAQIAAKVPGIRYAGKATSDDLDPMAGLKRRIANNLRDTIRAELLAEQKAGLAQDLGSTESKPVVPASTRVITAVTPKS